MARQFTIIQGNDSTQRIPVRGGVCHDAAGGGASASPPALSWRPGESPDRYGGTWEWRCPLSLSDIALGIGRGLVATITAFGIVGTSWLIGLALARWLGGQ